MHERALPHHARISIAADGATLEDLGSKNGTILNGQPVTMPTALADGSLIVLGAPALKFRIVDGLASTDTISTTR
jgi:pSer/pThr/pTyr-binding forkhead associated (FHA) protein